MSHNEEDHIKRGVFDKPLITQGRSDNGHKKAMKEIFAHPHAACSQQHVHITVHANYPVNAHPSPDYQPLEWKGNGIRVREIKLQPNHSLCGRVQVSSPISLETERGHGVTSNHQQHRDGNWHDCNDYMSSKLVGGLHQQVAS